MSVAILEECCSQELRHFIAYKGGGTGNELKVNSNGNKFYCFVVRYFQIGRPFLSSSDITVKYVSRLLFIEEHGDKERSAALRRSFDDDLREKYKVSFDEFMDKFSFVTDCAATITAIVGASASNRWVPIP